MFELKVFQSNSAKLIASRYAFFANHPERPRKGTKARPFFQALSALTGAGKTPILAQAVAQMRGYFKCEPIVLWMSKAKSVVGQTYQNFSTGGKYRDIIEDFRVINIQNLHPETISDGSVPLIIMTTTGLFNNRDQAAGTLNIYKKGADQFGDSSPWERLIERKYGSQRRPLIIVYDEGHNLSEQQTEILAELEPDAYLLASATLKLPSNLQKTVIQHIKIWIDEAAAAPFAELKALNKNGQPEVEAFITTVVQSDKVVKAQLVKKSIQFDGSTAAMERSLDDLFQRMKLLEREVKHHGLDLRPKAIYVCKTNITDDGEKDDPGKPFEHRKAPPIRIWRYLVEEKGVPPDQIAIYANLTFQEKSKPREVNLFSKGENDFDEFQRGDYRHIIFNLSLQEGWDDPSCYLAYVDKSMGSSIQVEQIIGRVLRQYGAKHYENSLLNTAHFFLRVDKKSVFTDTISKVKEKLQSEGAPIEITTNFGSAAGGADELQPREAVAVKLHHIFVDSEPARQRISEITEDFPTFSEGDSNTLGEAYSAAQKVSLENLEQPIEGVEWQNDGQSNAVRLRWLTTNAIRSRSARALAVVDLKDPKFDVRIQVQSKADKFAEKFATEVVEAFYQLSDLVYESVEPFIFSTLRVQKDAPRFQNGLYERYSGFNAFELAFAKALDGGKDVWHRNAASGGFCIPLLSEGDTSSFYPDFIVWKKGLVYCLDTKGGHLLTEAVARKLFDIKEDDKTKVLVRLITEGKQTQLRGKSLKGGYTVWKMKSGTPTPVHVADLDKAVVECLR